MPTFFKFRKTTEKEHLSNDRHRILDQITKAGFTGEIKIYDLGFDTEDSINLVIEGIYKGDQCCVAVGYGMNRSKLAIRTKWSRHAPATA